MGMANEVASGGSQAPDQSARDVVVNSRFIGREGSREDPLRRSGDFMVGMDRAGHSMACRGSDER